MRALLGHLHFRKQNTFKISVTQMCETNAIASNLTGYCNIWVKVHLDIC